MKRKSLYKWLKILLAILLIVGAGFFYLYKAGLLTFHPELSKVAYLQLEIKEYLEGDMEKLLPFTLSERLDSAILTMEAKESELSSMPLYHILLCDLYYVQGSERVNNGQNRAAIASYQEAVRNAHLITRIFPFRRVTIGNMHNALHLAYQEVGDLLKAEEELEQAIDYFEEAGSKKWLGLAQQNRVRLHIQAGEYEQALRLAEAAARTYEVLNMDHQDSLMHVSTDRYRAILKAHQAQAAAEAGDLELQRLLEMEAQAAADSVLAHQHWFTPEEQTVQWPMLLQSISIYWTSLPLAKKFPVLDGILAATDVGLAGMKRPSSYISTAVQDLLRAEGLIEAGERDAGLQQVDEGLSRLGCRREPNFTITSEEGGQRTVYTVFTIYNRLLHNLLEPDDDMTLLNAQLSVIEHFERSVKHFKSDIKHISYSKEEIELYEDALRTAFRVQMKEGGQVNTINYLGECLRSRLVQQSIQRERLAPQLEGELKAWLERDILIKEELMRLQAQVIQSNSEEEMAQLNQEINTQLARRFENYEAVRHQLPEEQSVLAGLVHLQAPEQEKLQAAIPEGEALVQLMEVGDDFLVLAMTRDEVLPYQVSFREELQQGLSVYKSAFHEDIGIDKFSSASHQVFRSLLEPVLSRLPADIRSLTFIRGGLLQEISFEACLVSRDEALKAYRELDYLIRHYTIKYDYQLSAYLRNLTSGPIDKPAPFLVCAPDYGMAEVGDECGELERLDSLQVLAFTLATRHGGTPAPTRERELAEAMRGARRVFWAAHGRINEQDPLRSHLVLAPEDGGCRLFIGELMNWEMDQADVVLGSCLTEAGRNIPGSGILSIAQAMTIGGARSLVANLGNVNDEMTTQQLRAYFQHLEAGLNKAEALQQAKLTYLATAPARLTPPFAWAKVILIGHGGPAYQ